MAVEYLERVHHFHKVKSHTLLMYVYRYVPGWAKVCICAWLFTVPDWPQVYACVFINVYTSIYNITQYSERKVYLFPRDINADRNRNYTSFYSFIFRRLARKVQIACVLGCCRLQLQIHRFLLWCRQVSHLKLMGMNECSNMNLVGQKTTFINMNNAFTVITGFINSFMVNSQGHSGLN